MGLPGLSPEQQGIGIRKDLTEVGANLIVPVWKRPTAVSEAAICIFRGAARCLNDTIQCNELVHNYFSHGFSF
jgi:hypothetical protein